MSDIKNLLKEIETYRDDMVAHNYPFQKISNIITKWKMKIASSEKPDPFFSTVSEQSQNELEPINSPMSEE